MDDMDWMDARVEPKPNSPEDIAQLLAAALSRRLGTPTRVEKLARLTGGASRQTFAFEAVAPDGARRRMILRREPPAASAATTAVLNEPDGRFGLGWTKEFEVIAAAGKAGVPVPRLVLLLELTDGLGQGFVMGFVEGETIARRILRDAEFARARQIMARQCGEIAARIHAIPLEVLPALMQVPTRRHLEMFAERLARWPEPMPVLEFGLRWLGERCPDPASEQMRLVHGDFRHGNLIVGPDGVRAVLDWEVTHVGDPAEDLGWIMTKAWRFGGPHPVGGFGTRENLFAGYEAVSGKPVDRARVRFWEIFGSLRWGIMCLSLASRHLFQGQRSLEHAAIGRRVSENEHDLLALIEAEEKETS
jgi:aminoglycoside phosphotransferase (APT) family kinase protein